MIAKKIAHIILAAGSSSRLGSPKQLLPWKNSSLIVNEIEKSLQLRTLTTFVVLGAHFETIQKEIKHFPVEILHNTNWESGMGASISFGIEHIVKNEKNVEAVLITLVDQPLIDEEHLNNLISKFNKNQEAIIATSMKDRIGVPAIFSKRYFNELLELNEDYGARQIIKKYKDLIIATDGKDKTYDIDTKEQYKRLSERIKQ
ncbi:nucleotidyltransferase family protein [Aquimarina sp. BL5]|uniref:nucleotidyltransferase family protein n=1 Tax=Aquimarina sp. BL5 TaxID=1714860 RepID=UPI000E5192CC|nr:nucleotidyltransferase family protein [Aquimarina sp. BL5]RKN00512.1 nucleotidyltransferase family protein [Aquimarina sp. BL5]